MFLENSRIVTPKRHRAKFFGHNILSHFRPVVHLPCLVGADSPDNHVIAVPDAERQPYIPTPTAEDTFNCVEFSCNGGAVCAGQLGCD